MVKGIIKRLIPVLCCIVVLISCMVVPASALGPSVFPDEPGTKIFPLVSGSMFYTTASSYDDEYRAGSSFGLCDATYFSQTDYLASYANIDGLALSAYDYGLVEWNIAQYVRTSETNADGKEKLRLYERYRLVSADGSLSPLFPWSCTFAIDDFGGLWDKTVLRELFYVHGRYEFIVNFSAYSIQDNKLLSVRKSYNGSSNGSQSVLFGSWMNEIESELQLEPGDPYYFADFTIMIPWGIEDQELQISRAANRVGMFISRPSSNPTAVYVDYPIGKTSSGSPVTRMSLDTFLTSNDLITGPGQSFLEGGDITSFLSGAASSVLDAPLFGEISLGGVLGMIFVVCVVFWVLKYFAGG